MARSPGKAIASPAQLRARFCGTECRRRLDAELREVLDGYPAIGGYPSSCLLPQIKVGRRGGTLLHYPQDAIEGGPGVAESLDAVKGSIAVWLCRRAVIPKIVSRKTSRPAAIVGKRLKKKCYQGR